MYIFFSHSEEEELEKVGVYIGEAPVSHLHNYFEVEILHMGIKGAVSVGKFLISYFFKSLNVVYDI